MKNRENAADMIGPRGELRDFIPRPGDLPYSAFVTSDRQRWGKRIQLATADSTTATTPNAKVSASATMIDTGDLGRPIPINVQVRFAPTVAGVGTAALNQPGVFSPINPVVLAGTLTITVRRGVDHNAPTAVDTYVIPLGSVNDIVPFDVITARALAIDMAITGVAASMWVEVIATPIHDIPARNELIGYQVAQNQARLAVVATPGNVVLLPARFARVQFIVINTSTVARMILRFGPGANFAAGAGIVGSIILPATGASTYESPIGGYNGLVSASWEAADAAGGALVTEGSYF